MAGLILTINNSVLSSHKIAPEEQLSIGRHGDNHIVIDDPSVSAHHAVVHRDDLKLFLRDLGSQNGTFVNDERITERQLGHQDWIAIGKHICIVDLYDSLSLESAENELKARSSAASDAEGTMLLDRADLQAGYVGFDYLSLLTSRREDHELNKRQVSIGRNADADIKIRGFWSIFAGKPSATISRINGVYILEHAAGMLKPRINGITVQRPTKLNHQDIIKIGPVEMQIRLVRRPSR